MELMIKGKNELSIYHQNIRSLYSKKEKLSTMLLEKHLNPHVMCLSKNHTKEHEISNFSMYGYKLAATCC
jgi:hypothetical protein